MRSLAELMRLDGRVALVTGGAGHIGRALCEALAELGAAVAVWDIHPERTGDFARSVTDRYGSRTLGCPVDLAREDSLHAAWKQTADWAGRLDILVHCAAYVGTSGLSGWATSFDRQSVATWRQALEVNLTAPFALTQLCEQALRDSGHGSVINVASIYGVVGPNYSLYEGTPLGNPAAYAASKGGLIQLTRWLATTLAPQVRVNCISPGGIERGQAEQFQQRYTALTPLKRMGHEEDLKGAVAFLASDLSRYVTGQNLMVDGGWTTW
uniref:SDR family oxidoreductase n=1 Tax=Schlesneria paludicola TaxID=360056 RepID=A0A7C2NT75_9PLAN